MKQFPRAAATLFAVAALLSGVSAMAEGFAAGAYTTTINPPLDTFIGGDALNRRFTGFHDELYAKALAVTDGVETVVIATTDTLGIGLPTIQTIRERVLRYTDNALPADHIIIASTHIHNGPDVVGIYGPDRQTSGVDPVYMNRMINETANAIVKALDAMEPATIAFAETTHGEGWVRNECVPDELDRSLTTLTFRDAETGDCVATLTNFACHPTILDGVHDVVSADYVGGFYREMHRSLPGHHLFVQGAIGGWIQPNKGDRSFGLADSYGKSLAADVLNALASAEPLPGAPVVSVKSATVHFPLENEGWKQLAAAGVLERDLGEDVVTEMAWFRIGDAQFATHPGETAPLHSLETKALMKTGPKFVLGLANDALGYINKPEFFTNPDIPDAEYLTRMSCGPETAPIMMKTLEELIP